MTRTKRDLSLLRNCLLAERAEGLNYRNYTLYPILTDATTCPRSALSLISALIDDLSFPPTDRGPSNPVAQVLKKSFRVSEQINQDMKGIARFAFAPVTELTDEANFIRILQINEIIFHIIASGCKMGADNRESIPEFIASISSYLVVATAAVQAVMRAVTPAGFKAFTAETGNISAIESENFACVEAHLTSVSEERLQSALFKLHPRASAIVRTRKSFFAKVNEISKSHDLSAHLHNAETLFTNWKRMHIAAMIKTLGPDRLNHEAVSYLRRFTHSTVQAAAESPSLNAAGGANDA